MVMGAQGDKFRKKSHMNDVGMKGTATACGISELPNTPDPYHTEAVRLTKPKPSSKHTEPPVISFPCLKCISIRERDERERERERECVCGARSCAPARLPGVSEARRRRRRVCVCTCVHVYC